MFGEKAKAFMALPRLEGYEHFDVGCAKALIRSFGIVMALKGVAFPKEEVTLLEEYCKVDSSFVALRHEQAALQKEADAINRLLYEESISEEKAQPALDRIEREFSLILDRIKDLLDKLKPLVAHF